MFNQSKRPHFFSWILQQAGLRVETGEFNFDILYGKGVIIQYVAGKFYSKQTN